MQLIWLPKAQRELRHVIQYISVRNPNAAERLEQHISHSAEMLRVMPHIHRPGRVKGTREAVVHPNYIIVYQVRGDAVWILSILHARQQYP